MPSGSPVDMQTSLIPQSGGMSGAPGAECAPAYRSELDETEIIRRYVPMVKRIATHLKGRLPETVQLDDLIQAGLIWILRIARHGEGLQAGDAALRRSIMNAMIDEARREAWAPVRTVRLAKAAARAMRSIKLRTGRDGSDADIAAEMAIPLSEYHRVLVDIAGIRLLHLDEFDEGTEERLQVADTQEKSLHQSRVLAALAASIEALPEREKLVVSLYYEHGLNMDEVGKVLGVNKSTVCRAHGRALLMLRNALADWNANVDATPQATGD
jgi:RNA polymerase sigma factor for flagellar operon FliA